MIIGVLRNTGAADSDWKYPIYYYRRIFVHWWAKWKSGKNIPFIHQ